VSTVSYDKNGMGTWELKMATSSVRTGRSVQGLIWPRLRFQLLGLAVLAAQSVAIAGLFDDEEARKQIAQLRTQVQSQQTQVEQRVTELEALAKSRSIVDLFNQMEALKVEVAKLRGMQEVLNNELDNAQKRQKDLYQDSDTRIRKLETQATELAAANKALTQLVEQTRADMAKLATAPVQPTAEPAMPAFPPAVTAAPAVATAPAAGAGAGGDVLAEQRAYDAALSDFRAAKYKDAANNFSGFLKTFPKSALASSAQYWLGNSLFAAKDFRGAINAQRTLVAQYPESNKVPDAMLNIGTAFSELDDSREARRVWQELVTKFPTSEAAVKAKQRLAR
jgi:tol-pal system protein YbgF